MKKKTAKKKTAKKNVQPKAKAEKSNLEKDLLDDITALEKKLSIAEQEWEDAKAVAKVAKREFDELVSELRKLISHGYEPMPLFGGLDDESQDDSDTQPTST